MLNRAEQRGDAVERRALSLYVALIVALFALLLLRLLQLQVLDSDRMLFRSISNIIQPVPTPAPRGNIYDRAGRPLAVNETVFRLLYKPPLEIARYFPDSDKRAELKAAGVQPDFLYHGREPDDERNGTRLEEIERLASYLKVPYAQLMASLESELRRLNGPSYYGYKPATLLPKLSFEQVVYLEEHRDEYQGFFIDSPFERAYPLREAGAHLLGFTGYASDADADFIRRMGFTNQEKVGKDGIELQYEALLHGQQGRRNIEVDRRRIFQDIVSEVPPEKGTDIYLTVDARVQRQSFEALNGQRGAIIVAALMPGHEGEIIALASSPAFDPYRINEAEYFRKLNNDTRIRPLTNRAYRGDFVPGSTFKLVSTTALLQTGTVTPGTSVGCGGKKPVGNRDFHCWNRAGHGTLSLVPAIARSCDIYFYTAGMRLEHQPDDIAHYAREFNYGAPTGIDLPWEHKGRVPDKDWWVRTKKKWGYTEARDLKWYPGNTCNYIIGQGDLVATPLQVLWSAAIVAWRGERYEPHLLFAHATETGKAVRERRPRSERTRLEPEALEIVEQGMRAAVSYGTCKQFDALGLKVCAKTGTAENRGEDHAWVVGYYPAGSPRYAFVCLVEHGGHGSEAAIPPMKQVLRFMKDNEPIKE